MDKEQLQKTIVEYYGKLPKEAQDVFSSMAWMEKLKDIGVKYSLDEKQMEVLGTETTLVLLGIIHIEEYNTALEKDLKLPKEITDKIASEMNEGVLKTVKEQLVKTFESNVVSLGEKEIPTVSEQKSFTTPTTTPVSAPTPVLDSRFISMPQNVQEAIRKSNWKEKLYNLAKKYSLNIEQSGKLEEITVKVMQNAIHPNQYEGELASKLETISKENISSLVNDINQEILKVIRELMQNPNAVINNDEIKNVSIPPYKVIKNEELIIKNEGTETLKPINPIKEALSNISISNGIEEKLKSAVASDHTVSDYSTPKISSPSSNIPQSSQGQPPKGLDPYRESFSN
jgi:hypothetical protein